MVKTKQESMFDSKGLSKIKPNKRVIEEIPIEMQDEIKHHYPIDVSYCDQFLLMVMKQIFCCVPASCCGSRHSAMSRMYDRGTKKLSKEVDIVNLIKTLRDIKIYFKSEVYNDNLRFEI